MGKAVRGRKVEEVSAPSFINGVIQLAASNLPHASTPL